MRHATLADYQWLRDHPEEGYGDNPLEHAAEALPIILAAKPRGVIDVGGFRGALAAELRSLGLIAVNADPTGDDPGWRMALPSLPCGPELVDCITCFDVLEHLPPSDVDASLRELARIARRLVCVTIYTDSDARMVNGEMVEMHPTQRPSSWWEERVRAAWPGWDVEVLPTARPERWLIVGRRA